MSRFLLKADTAVYRRVLRKDDNEWFLKALSWQVLTAETPQSVQAEPSSATPPPSVWLFGLLNRVKRWRNILRYYYYTDWEKSQNPERIFLTVGSRIGLRFSRPRCALFSIYMRAAGPANLIDTSGICAVLSVTCEAISSALCCGTERENKTLKQTHIVLPCAIFLKSKWEYEIPWNHWRCVDYAIDVACSPC